MAEAQQDQQQALPNQQHPPTQQQVDSNGTKENGNGTPGTKRTRPADEHAGNGSAGNGAPKGLYPLQIGHRTFKSGLEAKTFFTSFTKNFALGVTINTVSGSIISCAFLLRSLRPSTAPIPTSLPCDLVLTPTILATSVRKRHGRTHPARRVVHRPRRLRRIHWPRAHGSRELCAGVDCGWNGGGVQALNLVINNDTKPLLMHECKLYPDLYSPHHDAQQAAHQNKKPLIFFKDRMKEPLKVLWRHG